jgi:hypothetical protein
MDDDQRGHELWLAYCHADGPVERRAAGRRWWAYEHRQERKKARQAARDEQREIKAQACACLVEAFIDMRPWVAQVRLDTSAAADFV